MSRYWEIETQLDDNTNVTGNGDLDYEVYGKIAILLNKYVRKEEGKGLSTNDFNNEYLEKLNGIEDNAQVNTVESVSVNGGTPTYADRYKNIDIHAPTKTSELENDSDFAVTSQDNIFTENVGVVKDFSVGGNVSVQGDISLHDTTINGDLTVNGGIDGNMNIIGNESVSRDLSVGNDLTVGNNLTVSNDETITNDLSVGGDTTLSGDLSVSGDETIGGDLTVSGKTTLDDTDVNGDLSVSGDETVSGDLTVSGDTSLKNVDIDGSTVISGNTTVHGDLYVDGVTHTTTEEQINTTADTIVLRQNNPTSLGATYAGFIINKYNGVNELALVTDSDGTLRLGTGNGSDTTYSNLYWDDVTEKWYSDENLTIEVEPQGSLTSWLSVETIGDIKHYTNAVFTVINFDGLVPIMCRDEDVDMSNDALLKWNSTDRVARTINNPTLDGQILTYKNKPSMSTTVYTDGTNFYNVSGTSILEPSGTSGTPTLIGQFVNYSSSWYTKNTDWYLVDNFSDNTNWTVVSDQTTIDALELQNAVNISSVVYTTSAIREYSWELKTDAGVSFIGTRAEYNVAKLIPFGTVGHIPSGSLVILTDETDYLNSEDK